MNWQSEDKKSVKEHSRTSKWIGKMVVLESMWETMGPQERLVSVNLDFDGFVTNLEPLFGEANSCH